MKNSMRLVKKMDYALSAALLFIVLAGAVGFGLAGNHNHNNVVTPTLVVLWAAFVLCLVGFFFLLGFFFKCWTQRRNAWKVHVKRWGVSVLDLLEKMHGAPSGGEAYTIEQAASLMSICLGFRSPVSPASSGFKDLQVLERKGWVSLTFSDPKSEGGGDDVIALPTDQAWAAIDEMCPRDWSPEDFISRRVAYNAN